MQFSFGYIGLFLTLALYLGYAYNTGHGVQKDYKKALEWYSFKKIVVVKDYVKPWRDENGIQYVGIEDFLLDESLISR